MKFAKTSLAVAAMAALVAGCADTTTSPLSLSAVADAFISTPISYDQVSSSFVPSGNIGTDGWMPPPPRQGRGGPGMGAFMGGGIGDAFVGGIGFGPGLGRGPFGDPGTDTSNCTFSSATGRVTCPAVTINGLTVTKSIQFLTASGTPQAALDTVTTNSINVAIDVSGTVTHHNTETSTVHNVSNRTVTGLASGSTQRTVNGTSSGTEATTGTNPNGTFSATRAASDTTTGLIVPIQSGHPTYPTAGTVIRNMQASITYTGGTSSNSSRREVITYDGSATAHVTITQDGVTKSCTMPLPRGKLTCG